MPNALRELFSGAINDNGLHADIQLQPDATAQKFARALASGLPDPAIPLPDPEDTIAEADAVLQATDPSQYNL